MKRVATAVLAGGILATPLIVPSVATAVPAPYVPPPVYKVISVNTYYDYVDFSRRVAQCSPGAGGTCTITRAASVGTTVGVDFGLSASYVAGKLSFSTTAMSSTSVSCTSPKMTSSQRYRAYAVGTSKFYNIQKWQPDGRGGSKLLSTSARKHAWAPHTYSDIYCLVENA